MSNRKAPKAVHDGISTILTMWKMNPELTLPDLDLLGYQRMVDEYQQQDNQVKEAMLKLDAARVARESSCEKLSLVHTRIRSATRAYFGPNSTQMSQVGMVRTIERKPRQNSKVASLAKQ